MFNLRCMQGGCMRRARQREGGFEKLLVEGGPRNSKD